MCGIERERNWGDRTSFICAVVSRIAVCVVEEEGAEEGGDAEDLEAFLMVAGREVSDCSGGELKCGRDELVDALSAKYGARRVLRRTPQRQRYK